jgi:hypothetical protein
LIDAGQLHAPRQIQMHLQPVIRSGGAHKSLGLDRQQVVFSHQPLHTFVIHPQPALAQFQTYAPIAVALLVFGENPLDLGAHFHIFGGRFVLPQPAVKAGTTHPGQHAHSLDRQVALHRHQLPDSVVDAVSPGALLRRRRAPTFCKAPLKKSTSSVFSASRRLSCAF